MLVFVTTVPKGTDGVNIEGIFTHTDDICPCLSQLNMCLLVNTLRVCFDLCLHCFVQLLSLSLKPTADFLLDLHMLSLIQWKNCPSPFPLQLSLALILRRVEQAPRTNLVIDYRNGLKSVGEDDIGVHGCHVDVVDEGEGLEFMRGSHVAKGLKSLYHLLTDLVLVHCVLEIFLGHFDRNGKTKDFLHTLNQVLEGRRVQVEICRKISPIDTCSQTLHLASSICFRIQ